MEGGQSCLSAKSEDDKPKQSRELSETKEENLNQRDFNLNENAALSDIEQVADSTAEKTGIEKVDGLQSEDYSESGQKGEGENERLIGNGIERSTNGDDLEDGVKTRKKKKVKLELPDGGILSTQRVLRSSSAARECPKGSDSKENKHSLAVEEERKGDTKGKRNHVGSCDEVRREAKHKRGRPPKVRKTHGADGTRGIKTEHKAGISYDQDENIESHDKEQKFKRKRGRPPKLKISNRSDNDGSKLTCKLDRLPNFWNQRSDVDGLNLRRKRGRPPKTQDATEARCMRGKKMKLKHGKPPKVLNWNISDSGDESRKLKNSCGSRSMGPEYDEDDCGGMKKLINKRGRPPKVQKENSYGEESRGLNHRFEKDPKVQSDRYDSLVRDKLKMKLPTLSQEEETDKSDSEAKKRLKLHNRFSELQGSNPSNDEGRRREGGQKTEHDGRGKQSRSEAKKLLRDRILQLLLAAGWTVEYRPRNGKDYNDAVYVNPEGKTHWSVTLAYKVYKERLESCTDDQKNSIAGSSFALLPEEELRILERKTQKHRGDKGKKRPKWKDGDTAENLVTAKRTRKQKLHIKKLHKERLRMQKLKLSVSHHARPVEKKLKGSRASQNLECKSPSRLSESNRKKKREEKHTRKRCALLARSSLEHAYSKDDGYTLYEGKRSVLGWMIDSAVVPLNGKVLYMNSRKTRVLLEGMITKEGIQCDCCNEVFSISDFEIHAGSKLNQPFKSLYLEDGNSLLQCSLESWNKQDESQLKGFHFVDVNGGDPNDDTCGICGDGGDLICCDGCPSTFHQSCLDIKKFPSGAWFCVYCSCKFCREVEAANDDSAALSPLLNCFLCEEKYHQTCIGENGTMVDDRSNRSFCSNSCQEIFEGLQLLIGVKQALPEGFSWTFLRRFDLAREVSAFDASEKIECNSKLAVAFSVMDECFSPLVDHRSGINLLQNIVYNFGSNFRRLNYHGFLTAILERRDEVIAVACIRIHGNQLAEMPFIGTRYAYRRQGMCRQLMSGIESALCSLKVEKLVIPAVSELTETWTSVFGFKPVEEPNKKAIRNLNLLVFPGVDMLEKPLLKHNAAEADVFSSNGYHPLVLDMCQHTGVEANKNDGKCSSSRLDSGFPGHESAGNVQNRNNGTADVESPLHLVDSCSGFKTDLEVERNKDLEPNSQLSDGCLEDKEGDVEKATRKDLESQSQSVDSCFGDRADTKSGMDDKRESHARVVDDSQQDKTDMKMEKISDVETSSRLFDGCFGDETDFQRETDNVLQTGYDTKELAWSVADGETEEVIDRETLASALQAKERSECHNASVPSRTDTKTLENIVGEPKIHRFECHTSEFFATV